MERAGQVRSVCGENLLVLFRDVWPDFLRFETGLLTRYLASQRAGLEQDPALNALLTQQQVPHAGKTLADIYVQPRLEQEIWKYTIADFRPFKVSDFTREMKSEDVQELRARLQKWAGILAVGSLWAASSEANEAEEVGRAAETLVSYLRGGWDTAYAEYERSRTKEQLRKTLKRETLLSISYSAAQRGQLQKIAKCTLAAFEHISALIESANRFAKTASAPRTATEVDAQFTEYCRVRDLARLLPDFIVPHKLVRRLVFQWDFIRSCSRPALIAGPAEYGKSSFCRWHWLQDAQELMAGRDGPIPVYVRLHQFAHSPLTSFQETFLFPEVAELLTRSNASRRTRLVRLYLDGLDEIPDRQRQADVVRLAQAGARGYNGLQVLITGRDHVWGPWLGWMPRLRIAPLDSTQAQQLAAN